MSKAQLERRVRGLNEALRPFAEEAYCIETGHPGAVLQGQPEPDHRAVWFYCGEPTPTHPHRVTVGDFRRAARALE